MSLGMRDQPSAVWVLTSQGDMDQHGAHQQRGQSVSWEIKKGAGVLSLEKQEPIDLNQTQFMWLPKCLWPWCSAQCYQSFRKVAWS